MSLVRQTAKKGLWLTSMDTREVIASGEDETRDRPPLTVDGFHLYREAHSRSALGPIWNRRWQWLREAEALSEPLGWTQRPA